MGDSAWMELLKRRIKEIQSCRVLIILMYEAIFSPARCSARQASQAMRVQFSMGN